MPTHPPPQTPAPAQSTSLLRQVLPAILIVALALLVRIPALGHSLWYDEMHTLGAFIRQPWSHIVAGEYSPNNHILFTLLAKLVSSGTNYLPDLTILIRFPSLIAGSLVPIALAAPLRRTCPKLALAIAILAALHPWSISFSTWARGYALLLLLCIIATNLLPTRRRIIAWPYALTAALAMYTQPLAILLIAAHSATMLILRRELFATWFRSAVFTGIITLALYAPFFAGAKSYWSRPERPSAPYTQFLLLSAKYTLWGGDRGGIPAIAVAILILTAGSCAAWQNHNLRPQLLTFALTSILGLIAPLAIPLAGEVRAMLWLIPLYCICAIALIGQATRPAGLQRWIAALSVFLVLLAVQIMADIWIATIPAQPIRDTLDLAARLAGDRTPIIGIYMGSREAGEIYGVIHHFAYQLEPDNPPRFDSLPSLKAVEAKLSQPPYAVVFFEQFLHRDQPDLWKYLHDHYTPIRHLDGRLSPATIYLRNAPPTKQP